MSRYNLEIYFIPSDKFIFRTLQHILPKTIMSLDKDARLHHKGEVFYAEGIRNIDKESFYSGMRRIIEKYHPKVKQVIFNEISDEDLTSRLS